MIKLIKYVVHVLAAGLLLGGLLAALDYRRFERQPLRLDQPATLLVTAGMNPIGLVDAWAAKAWLDRPRDRLWLRLRYRLKPAARPVQAGEYRIRPGQSVIQILAMLEAGEVYLHELTIPEGWQFSQLRQALAGHHALSPRTAGWSDADIMRELGRAGVHPEGRFLPETYAFPRGMTDLAFLARAAEAMDVALAEAWADRDADLPLQTPEQALILASIIEKETAVAQERAQIAGVFVERLVRGMRLQTDPTVIYGLGANFDGNLRRRDLRADTPYNTYTRHGLPPTPIALPGRAALQAAVNPLRSDKLYFVARGDGSHEFSATLAAHQRAVRKFQLK